MTWIDARWSWVQRNARGTALAVWLVCLLLCVTALTLNGLILLGHAPGGRLAALDLYYEPGMNGIEATRQITAALPHIGVLVVTMFEDDDSVFAAMRAGARGYLLKGSGREEMLLAIRAVARGEAIFGPAIARRLMQYFAVPRRGPDVPAEAFPDLTERERQILALLAAGRTNQEISEALFLTSKTVRNYVSNIFAKLQVTDRAQAIIRAREAGLGRDGG